MAKSNKVVIWSLFAAGGTLTAFLTPILVVLALFAAMGMVPDLFTYEFLHAFAAHWLGKLVIFAVITLSLLHAAYRLYVTLHDFGLRADRASLVICYGIAAVGILSTLFSLFSIS